MDFNKKKKLDIAKHYCKRVVSTSIKARDTINEDDEGRFWMSGGELDSVQVDSYPFCGIKAPTRVL